MAVVGLLPSAPAITPRRNSHGATHHRRRRRGAPRMSTAPPDLLTAAARLLWGRSLPPQPLVAAARTAWSAAWHLMMRQLAPSSGSSGSYSRPASAFPTVPQHYHLLPPQSLHLHLYVGLPCPWAHRTLIVRALRSLETLITVSVASPGADGSWEFAVGWGEAGGGDLVPGLNRANEGRTLREVYGMRRGGYDGRCTVPMLWDAEKGEVACNESYGIMEFLNSVPGGGPDLAPPHLRGRIEVWNRIIYPNVNNGVYRCGFAQSQEAYDAAAAELFGTLEVLEAHLGTSRYLCGDALTLADVCLFTTLIRFDLVYNILFKCTKKKLVEYPNLCGYTRDIYQIPKVAATCNFDAIMDGYYKILFPLNPSNIRPFITMLLSKMRALCLDVSSWLSSLKLKIATERIEQSSNGQHRRCTSDTYICCQFCKKFTNHSLTSLYLSCKSNLTYNYLDHSMVEVAWLF
ncbi:hypothetical protein Taro_028283 [Colocasia esculenta]|uniref:GST C-terminal domain-containing protein n=1 Tax=Colocasia esculenta TaxID=4460 RepID=A0A843VAV7_COLES|nr:hypothetical protein [Colocasia esculenta]